MSDVCVRVAVRIRPLLPKEVLYHHKVCVRIVPETAQVMLGEDRLFSFDHAFGPSASQDEVYESCVQRLVESLIDGDNATVFCYGQTGSGKTYTLGGGNQDEEGGILDRVAQDVFLFLADKRKQFDYADITVKVSYVELYREELRDLLELQTTKKELHIREDERGNTVLVGAKEVVVTSAEELLSNVETGNALRHTSSTGMNDRSSRSHTILTIQVILSCHNNNSSLKAVTSSKLCLVDLAGSERAGKTGNTGARLKESAFINTGLLALGNVIRALSEQGRNRHSNSSSAHVPYRDAKITRLLRDSLGGTAQTLMVVCVSPSHHFVGETLNVLQFASKARHIQNRPGETSDQTKLISRPTTTWHPSDARVGELEYEVQTLRELLKGKERELGKDREKTGQGCQEGDDTEVSCQTGTSEPDKKATPEEESQYRLLAEEAAVLLLDISDPSQSLSLRLRLQDWQERLTAVSHSSQTHKDYSKGEKDQPDHFTLLKLNKELKKCQQALHIEEQLLEQKDAELIYMQKELKQLLEERKTYLISLEEEKQRFRIQTEQLVNQQILIGHLRRELMTFKRTASGATVEAGGSADLGKRPHSVPLIRHSSIWRSPRKIHSSPPAYMLERVMAAFKMRGNLLLAEMEENDEVYCPFLKQQKKEEEVEDDDNDTFLGITSFRRSLNRTWTSQQTNSPLNTKNTGADQTWDGKPVVQQPQRATGTKENQLKQRHMRKAKITASATERMVRDLSVSMRMKEELIKELEKTDKETQFLDTHDRQSDDGGEASVFARLSLQSQQVRAEMYRSLQHMREQRSQLQGRLSDSENSKALHKNGEQSAGVSTIFKQHNLEDITEQLCDNSWLEEEEEHVLQQRAALKELEEEMRRREEVILHREACLEQKSKLETKMLCSSQALSQNLLHVSMQLKSLEEQLQSSNNVRKRAGVTIEELEKERNMLKQRKDTLDVQLKDNRVLTVEETHSLLQLEEAIEALDAALEFKNRLIQDKKKKLVTNFSLHQSQNAEPAQLCDVTRKLMDLSLPEALQLLVKYFNKVVCLREAERHLHLDREELKLHSEEQKMELREMKAAVQHLSLDADRRLTQQHRDHQLNIQLLLQKLKEGTPGEAQQATQEKLQRLEKELFFYKSTSRQLKKKLKELLGDALYTNVEPSCSQEPTPVQKLPIYSSSSEAQTHSKEIQTRRRSHTIRNEHQTKCPSLSSDCQSLKNTKIPEYNQILTQSQGKRAGVEPKERSEMTPVRVCRRDLKQIWPAELQVSGSTTGRRQSALDASTESEMKDSIEILRKTNR